jgi:hypothetical protein
MHRFEPITTSLLLWHSIAVPTRLSYTYFLEILTIAQCKSDTLASKGWKESAEMWNKKRNLTTLWLCTMATGKGQGTQNWSHTEAYDDGP